MNQRERQVLPQRFIEKIRVQENGCQTWTGAKSWNGYGQFRYQGRVQYAHRVAYTLLVGPIPDELQLDHLCRNRACVNTDHLQPVTGQVNINRGRLPQSEKTHCPKGHPYTLLNTIWYKGQRYCRECKREWNREYMKRKYWEGKAK